MADDMLLVHEIQTNVIAYQARWACSQSEESLSQLTETCSANWVVVHCTTADMCARPLPLTYLQEISKHTHDAQGQSLLHSTEKAFSVALSKRVIVGLKQLAVYDWIIM